MAESTKDLLGMAGDAVAALLFMQSYMMALDVFSAVNSSPWTAENFGGDAAKAATCREYVMHGLGNIAVGAGVAAIVSRRWWPVIGGAAGAGYMYWLYERALARGAASQSVGWNGQTAGGAQLRAA